MMLNFLPSNQPQQSWCSLVGLVGLTCMLTGCGSGIPTGDIVPTAPAAGIVTYQGKPLEYFQVRFLPEDGRPAAGVTGTDGVFVLGTNNLDDGAPVGTHKVSFVYKGPPMPDDWGVTDFTPIPPPKVKLPPKYEKPETSGITVEVPKGGDRDIVIALD